SPCWTPRALWAGCDLCLLVHISPDVPAALAPLERSPIRMARLLTVIVSLMPWTARSESFEAVDVHGLAARRRSPGEQARRHRRGRAWTCARLDSAGNSPMHP